MSETMGQIIRRLRKERNLTQEELAEQLNITPQAVSRWENGTGLPDISQIVPLASVFGVTTDVLFNIEGTTADDEAYKIVNTAEGLIEYGKIDTYLAAYDRMTEGLQKYPNNLILLNTCMGLGLTLCLPENGSLYASERADEITSETERQAKLIIAYSKNASDSMRAHQVLMFLYSSHGEYEKAGAEAYHFPVRTDFTLYSNLARIDEAKGDWEHVIKHLGIDNAYLLQTFEDNIVRLGKAYYASGKYTEAISVYENWFDIMHTLFGDRFPSFHDFDSGDLYLLLAQACLAVGEPEKALYNLEKSILFYLDLILPTNKIRIGALQKNPPLVDRGITDITVSASFVKERLQEKLSSSVWIPLRDSERFQTLLQKVEEL